MLGGPYIKHVLAAATRVLGSPHLLGMSTAGASAQMTWFRVLILNVFVPTPDLPADQ